MEFVTIRNDANDCSNELMIRTGFFFMYEFYLAYSMSPRAVGIKYDKYSCLYAWNSNYVHTPVCWQPLIKPYTYILGLLSWPMGTTKHDRNCFVTIVQTLYRCHFSPKTGKTKEKKRHIHTIYKRNTEWNAIRCDQVRMFFACTYANSDYFEWHCK